MKASSFFEAVNSNPKLLALGIADLPGGPVALIEERRSHIRTSIALAALPALAWAEIEPVMLGLKTPNPIYHISRVCGYYSRVENWNESKRGELADRQAGQAGYRVEGE